MRKQLIRGAGVATALGVAVASLAALGPLASAGAATASVSIDAPEAPRAGTVELTGTVGVRGNEVTTVLYVIDATRSTGGQTGADCSGDPDDDLNDDGSVGDILDCEIAGVEALNGSLAGTTGLQVGLVAFANEAAAADLDPAGTASFLPPAFTGGDARPRINTVARSVVREQIRLYDPRLLGGSGAGTAFNSAVDTGLATLATAPAGPKWIMFLSDGQAPVDDARLARLSQSGVKLRSFGIGADASCSTSGSLYKLAAATGESCTLVTDPSSLAAGLTGSQPDAVNGVTVSIDGVSVAATLDAVGGWRARFTLGAGTYTATARAVLASGTTASAQRTFTVAPPAGGPAPAPGTVTPGPGALKGTVVKVKRPQPSRAALPAKVTGRVGSPVRGLTPVRALSGTRVQLQARSTTGAPWTTVDRSKVKRSGRFALTWKVKPRLGLLRVVLPATKKYAGSAAAVPKARISSCKVAGRSGGWSITCRTTAKAGSAVRLLAGGRVVDRARVKDGSLRLVGRGRVGVHTIDITVGRRHVRLAL